MISGAGRSAGPAGGASGASRGPSRGRSAGMSSPGAMGRCMWWVNWRWKAPPPPTRTPPPSPLDTGVPSGSVTAVWPPFQPMFRAPGAVPGRKPRARSAASSLPVLNRLP